MNRISFLFLCCFPFFLQAQGKLNMSLLGQWDEPGLPTASGIKYNDIWGYADCEGNEYAIVGSARYIHFFDITDPTNPNEVGRFEASTNSIWRDFKTYGHYAYAVADQGSDGLLVFDLSALPASVSLVFQDNQNFTRSHNVFIDVPTGRLYLAGSNAIFNGVAAYSLTENPAEPTFLGTHPLPGGYFHDIYVRNHLAFCSHGGNGLWAYDFSDYDNIQPLGNLTSYPQQGYNHASWLNETGTQLIFADETHGTSLKLADVTDLSNINILSLFRSELLAPAATNSIPHNPFIRGQYAIVSYYHDGVQVFDLSNPDEVERVAYYDTYPENQNYSGYEGCWGVYPFLPSGNIIASDITHGLFVLSADSISFEAPAPIDAGFEVATGSPVACAGDTIRLEASQNGLNYYEWMLNGEVLASGPQLAATQPGAYQLVVSNGACTKFSEVLQLDFTSPPQPELPASPFIYCGEAPPALFTPSTGDTYNWFLNGEPVEGAHEQEINISEGGIYQVEIIENGCGALSDELEVILGQMPTPFLNVLFPDTYCAGTDVVDIEASGSGNQYYTIYEENSTVVDTFINSYTLSTSGIYHIQAYTEYCSMPLEPALEITFNEPAIPTVTAVENILTSSPGATYQWLNGGVPVEGATQQSFTAEETGLYAVETTDANGCIARSEAVQVDVSSGLSLLVAKGLHAYPNPVGEQLFLEATTPPQAYRVLNSNGKEIAGWRSWAPGRQMIEMSSLPSGIYLLQLLFEEGAASLRIAKK
ncbi:MAG: choice-of-anchor B family protein [Phaeodactylibacter sp.]|nr:choice-of-anchor B family protein [Phaeodactylibacter sp.]MCB9050628.1 choice-of-anchor B family protein [Lewinellaceae bacterium]